MQYTIFADGSSLGNPGPGGWGTIVSDGTKVFELGGREAHTTNNRMELTAAIEALTQVSKNAEVKVYTDSSYVINGITKWVEGWKKNNWKTATKKEVLNQDLWERLLVQTVGKKIVWEYVPGHAGVPGNERVDEIARTFAEKNPTTLFVGPETKYEISLVYDKKEKVKKSSSSSKKPYAYISLVNHKLMKHATWADCEKRVKGVALAKYKKVFSESELREVAKVWGVRV